MKGNWRKLATLELHWNYISDEAAFWLSKGQWNDLVKLDVGASRLTIPGVFSLISGHWLVLNDLDIRTVGSMQGVVS